MVDRDSRPAVYTFASQKRMAIPYGSGLGIVFFDYSRFLGVMGDEHGHLLSPIVIAPDYRDGQEVSVYSSGKLKFSREGIQYYDHDFVIENEMLDFLYLNRRHRRDGSVDRLMMGEEGSIAPYFGSQVFHNIASNTADPYTTRHNTTQHNTTQHNTTCTTHMTSSLEKLKKIQTSVFSKGMRSLKQQTPM